MMGGREAAEATVLSVDLGCDQPELEECLQEAINQTAAYDGGIIQECCFETLDPIPTPRGGRKGQEEAASWDQLMERVELVANHLPKLSTISFDWTIRSPRLGNSFPVRSMAMLLEMEKDTLSSLSLKQWGSTLAGTTQDFERFFRALSDCRQLKSFLIDWDCQFHVTDYQSREEMMMTADQWVAESILLALSSLRVGLESVTFLAGRNSYSAQAMKTLCSSSAGSSSSGEGLSLHITNCSLTKDLVEAICGPTSTISALHLEDVQQDDDEDVAQELGDWIWHHPSLKRFSFDGILRIASTLMEGMTDEQPTTLEEVSMEVWCHSRYDPQQEEGDEDEEEQEASTTRTTPSLGLPPLHQIPLKKLHLEIWDMDPTESLEMAKAMVVSQDDPSNNDDPTLSSPLEQLHLEFNFDDDVGDALRQEIKDTVSVVCDNLEAALKTNNASTLTLLEDVQIAFGEGCGTFARLDREPSYQQLKYWLHLNKAGRGKLLDGSMEDQPLWLDTLATSCSNDDINVAYWILSSNPGLFFSTT